MLAVLSPAKTLDMGGTTCKLRSKPRMNDRVAQLLPTLKKLSAKDLKKLMGLSDDLAQLNHARYAAFNSQPEKQACCAFDGPAYRGLRAEDFGKEEQSFANDSIRILCGLYGVLRPYDAIRPYRLEMGVKLPTAKGKTLYDFWGDAITESLSGDLLSGGKPKVLVNCASQEYWKAVRPSKFPAGTRVVTCDFPGPAVFAKKARGLMCRHIVKNRVQDVEGLKRFKGEGGDAYAFDAGKSTAAKLVFLRKGGGAGRAEQAKRPAAASPAGAAKRRRAA